MEAGFIDKVNDRVTQVGSSSKALRVGAGVVGSVLVVVVGVQEE